MSTATRPMYKWQDLPWTKIERAVFKRQKRIYQAAQRGDDPNVHRLQRLLLQSWSARCLAVRRVTQDNQGKKTAGVDGIKSLTPTQRLQLVNNLDLTAKAQPTRRVWIPKPGRDEKRPLGIPTMTNRAEQALVKLALEPEWEARFEPNSYGFRPGRSAHDALDALFKAICHKAKYVLDADIQQCFDQISHPALLTKLHTFPKLRRIIRAWLKAGVMDGDDLFPTEQGVPQGSVASPLLANVALHGLETFITSHYPQATLVRYADDLVALHPDLDAIQHIQQLIQGWLNQMGLALKPSKTRITHTLQPHDGPIGFDFLGFHIRQYPVGKTHSAKSTGRHPKPLGFKTLIKPSPTALKRHHQTLKSIIRAYRSAPQAQLIGRLNQVIRGWTAYYATVAAKATFSQLAHLTFRKLKRWAIRRHPNKPIKWVITKYWRLEQGSWTFAPVGGIPLHQHQQTPIKRHTKVQGRKSPFDGDWLYWATRLGRHPQGPPAVSRLLKQQQGRCPTCQLYFKLDDHWQVDHIIPRSQGGSHAYQNLQLVHVHCHHLKSAQDRTQGPLSSADDNSQITEEPCEANRFTHGSEAEPRGHPAAQVNLYRRVCQIE